MRCRRARFREDLFYRLNVITIHIPPLRERREEIPVFLDFFLRKYSEFYGKQPARFTDYAMTRMQEYSWPGNIRELENLVKRYVIVGNEAQIIRELSTHKPIMSSLSGVSAPPSSRKISLDGSLTLAAAQPFRLPPGKSAEHGGRLAIPAGNWTARGDAGGAGSHRKGADADSLEPAAGGENSEDQL